MKTFYLNNNTKSHVNEYQTDGEIVYDLVSYGTRVASYNHSANEMTIFGYYSATTGKHINEFLEYLGFDRMTKKEMFSKFNLTK